MADGSLVPKNPVDGGIPSSVDNHWSVGEEDRSLSTDRRGGVDYDVLGADLVSDGGSAQGYHYSLSPGDRLRPSDPTDESYFHRTELTHLVWVRGGKTGNIRFVVYTGDSGDGNTSYGTYSWYWGEWNDGTLNFTVADGGSATSLAIDSSVVLDGEWHLVAMRVSDANSILSVVVDGSEVGSATVGSMNLNNGSHCFGGAPDGSRRTFTDELDYAGFSTTYMTLDEITSYYKSYPRS